MYMTKHNQDGVVNPLLLPLILSIVFLVAVLSFGGWAFTSRQDYKNNTDQKVALAVTAAESAESARKDKQFAEASKNPLKTYTAPEQFGSLALQYPRTWSAYVDTGNNGADDLDGYFNPDVVPTLNDENSTFALRLQVLDRKYSDVLRSFSSTEEVMITPYALPKLPKVVGVKLTGQIEREKQGVMVLLPVRDKTLQVYTESQSFENDFNNIILANLTFSP